jgi:hypothetical protein
MTSNFFFFFTFPLLGVGETQDVSDLVGDVTNGVYLVQHSVESTKKQYVVYVHKYNKICIKSL